VCSGTIPSLCLSSQIRPPRTPPWPDPRRQRPGPQGIGCCDHNGTERLVNVLTSLPYVCVGIHAYRNRRTEAGKLWGASIAGVGVASGVYHATSGRAKHWARKMDFWAIAYS
jgi:hypothetical protein